MWISEPTVKMTRGHLRPAVRAVCTECGYKTSAAGWINLAVLNAVLCRFCNR